MKKALLAVAAAALAACAAAPDEAWIRIIRISTAEGENPPAVTVVASNLRDSSTDTVDVEVENFALVVGSSPETGVGIAVHRALVEYTLGGYGFPAYDYPVNLYLPAVSSGSSGSEGASTVSRSTGVIYGLPIAPATLKGWILNPANFPSELLKQPVRLQAKITIWAKTDEGRELDTSATVSVEFTSGSPASPDVDPGS